jgi:hypothetical protein
MPDTPTPWVGLAALAARFLLPLLPDWLFEGPRTSKHWLRRHICGDCGAPWTDEHSCTPRQSEAGTVLRGQLRRLPQALHGARAAIDREAPERFRGPVRVQRIRQSPIDWVSQRRSGAHVREVPSRAGATRALPGHQGEAS